jgi:hypothetical protein
VKAFGAYVFLMTSPNTTGTILTSDACTELARAVTAEVGARVRSG